ncbi:MAG: glycosyltransferase family 4 protein [Chloroflexi bacterium]|nr:glycosyltransferase family 4 protein [Chloroflexota bacterium]
MTARILYLSPNGAGTALVRSQVLPYLEGLRRAGHVIHLLTFERAAGGEAGPPAVDGWHPIRARRGGHLLVKVLDIAAGALTALRVVRGQRIGLLHARSYVPAAIAWIVWRLTGTPFVFDMRGFLGEEYVDAGNWTRRDIRYRALRFAERRLLRDAAEVVVLTARAAERLRSEPAYARYAQDQAISVVPCAVALERFRPRPTRRADPTLVYSGSLGMWYLLDEMIRVYAYARELVPDLRLLVLNRDAPSLVRESLARTGVPEHGVEVRGASFDEMPELLAGSHVGIALLKQVGSKLGSSPIKVAEYLACGLPVVVNAALGDTDELVRAYGAGHVVESYAEKDLRAAGAAVARLATDERARANARRLAEDVFDVRAAVDVYLGVYRRVLSPSPAMA